MIDKIEALAADIDMTLTAKGADMPEIVKKAFCELHNQGVLLGLATGREVDEKLLHQGEFWNLPFEFDFIVGMNGGMIYDAEDQSMWTTDLLSTTEMKEILAYFMPLIEKYSIAVNVEGGGNHNAMNINGELLASMKRHGFIFEDKTGDVDGFCDKPCYKFLFRTEPEYEKQIHKAFNDRFSDKYQLIGTFPGTVELMHKGISKGDGMKRYADKHHLDLDNVIAFGDNENDNSLLKACGWGVCLKNGAQGTKDIADAITEYDCENGGVGHYLFDHYLNNQG